MNKAYNLINWVNNETKINEDNLNKMSKAIDTIDDRVVSMDKTLSGQEESRKQSVEAAATAAEAKEIALEAAERAELYMKNAEAISGVAIATKDRAGLIKGGNNHIEEDGTLMLITTTDSTTQPNSYAGREMVLEIGGVSVQDSTAGNQLLDFDNIIANNSTVNVNNDTITVSGTHSYSFARLTVSNPELYAGQNLTLSCESWSKSNANASVSFQAQITDTDGNIEYHDGTTNKTFEIPKNVSIININVYANNSSVALDTVNTTTIKRFMLNAGTTALPYEKFSGGIPAPNPSYPMEIKKSVVSGIKTHWKNFINQACVSANEAGKHFLKAGTYTVTRDASEVGNSWYLGAYDSNNNVITENTLVVQGFGISSTKEYWYGGSIYATTTFTINVDCYVKIGVLNGSGKSYLMLNEGTTALPYEPYTESSYTFSQPIELHGMNGVRDVITAKPNKRRFVKVVYNGSENWIASTSVGGRYFIEGTKSSMLGRVMCSHAIGTTIDSAEINECLISNANNGRFIINTEFATLDEWKAHLAEKPMTVVYELAEETTEVLPIADQIGLNSLATYDGITYVEFIYEGPQPTFRGKYGTSEVGGMTLESLLVTRNNELKQDLALERISALETTLVNNI